MPKSKQQQDKEEIEKLNNKYNAEVELYDGQKKKKELQLKIEILDLKKKIEDEKNDSLLKKYNATLQLKNAQLRMLNKDDSLANNRKSGLSNIIRNLVSLFLNFGKQKSLDKKQEELFIVNSFNPKETIGKIFNNVISEGLRLKTITSSDLKETDTYRKNVLNKFTPDSEYKIDLASINSNNFKQNLVELFKISNAKVSEVIKPSFSDKTDQEKIKSLTSVSVIEDVMKITEDDLPKNKRIEAITQAITMLHINKKFIKYREDTDNLENRFITRIQTDSIMKKAKNMAKIYVATNEYIKDLIKPSDSTDMSKDEEIKELSICIAAANVKIEAIKNITIVNEKRKKTRNNIMNKFSESIYSIKKEFDKFKIDSEELSDDEKKKQYDAFILNSPNLIDDINYLSSKADDLYDQAKLQSDMSANSVNEILQLKKAIEEEDGFINNPQQNYALIKDKYDKVYNKLLIDADKKVLGSFAFASIDSKINEKARLLKDQLLYQLDNILAFSEMEAKKRKNVFV